MSAVPAGQHRTVRRPPQWYGRLSHKSPRAIAAEDFSTAAKTHVSCLGRCFALESRLAAWKSAEPEHRANSGRDRCGTRETRCRPTGTLFRGGAVRSGSPVPRTQPGKRPCRLTDAARALAAPAKPSPEPSATQAAAPTPCPSCRESALSDAALNFTLLVWTRQPRRQYKLVSNINSRSEPLLHERGTPSEKALNELGRQCSTG